MNIDERRPLGPPPTATGNAPQNPPSRPLTPGTVLGDKYRLARQIGHGAMGVVWAAVNEATSREVAVKLIVGSTPDLRRRLLREARACGALKHPNVIDLYDVAQTAAGEPFLVMELLSGETLSQVLKRKRRLDSHEAAEIALDVARALEAAHTIGVVHRDLKPANVFLHVPLGKADPVVKVLDFGVAKNLADDDGVRTVLGGLVGSPSYMSPEQARADRDIDARSDIWSLGVVLFQMLTGVRPFTGDEAEILRKIGSGPIPMVAELVRNVDPRMNDVVAGCLKRDRAERFGSAPEVIRMLEPLVSRSATAGGAVPQAPRPPSASTPEVAAAGIPDGILPAESALPAEDPEEETLRFQPRMAADLARRPVPPAPPPPPHEPAPYEQVPRGELGPGEGVASGPAKFPITAIIGAPRTAPWEASAESSSTGDLPPPGDRGPSGPSRPQQLVRPPFPGITPLMPSDMTPHGTIIIGQGDAARLRPAEANWPAASFPSTAPVVHSSIDAASPSIDAASPGTFAPSPAPVLPMLPSNPWVWKVLAGAGATAGLICVAGAVVYLVATRNPQGAGNPGDLATKAAQEAAQQQPAAAAQQPASAAQQPALAAQQPAAAETAPEPSAAATATATTATATATTAPSELPAAPVEPAAAPTTAKPALPPPTPATAKVPPSQTGTWSAPPPKSKKRCDGLKFLERERCLKGR
jgi:serine/threonine-protein kinase